MSRQEKLLLGLVNHGRPRLLKLLQKADREHGTSDPKVTPLLLEVVSP
jgi:hypothetical protein